MKVTNSAEKVTPFGGFNFVFKSFKDSGLPDLIDKELGMRVKTFGFSYSDIFTNHMAVYFNGGDCTEDVNDHLREHLHNVPGMHVCSADTIFRGIRQLSTYTLYFDNPDSGVKHGFNLNSNKEAVAFYNARGESERVFDVMNNDFGWAGMPCPFLSENTAFM